MSTTIKVRVAARGRHKAYDVPPYTYRDRVVKPYPVPEDQLRAMAGREVVTRARVEHACMAMRPTLGWAHAWMTILASCIPVHVASPFWLPVPGLLHFLCMVSLISPSIPSMVFGFSFFIFHFSFFIFWSTARSQFQNIWVQFCSSTSSPGRIIHGTTDLLLKVAIILLIRDPAPTCQLTLPVLTAFVSEARRSVKIISFFLFRHVQGAKLVQKIIVETGPVCRKWHRIPRGHGIKSGINNYS